MFSAMVFRHLSFSIQPCQVGCLSSASGGIFTAGQLERERTRGFLPRGLGLDLYQPVLCLRRWGTHCVCIKVGVQFLETEL